MQEPLAHLIERTFGAAERGVIYRLIRSRHHVRHFAADPIPPDTLHRILEAALHGTLGDGMPSWHVILVTSPTLRVKILEAVEMRHKDGARVHPNHSGPGRSGSVTLEAIAEAPLHVALANDRRRGGSVAFTQGLVPDTDIYTSCLAIPNMWLAASAEGLGVEWVGLSDYGEVAHLLDLPCGYDITPTIAAYAQITRGVDPLGSLITLPLSQRETKLTTAIQYKLGVKSQLLNGRAEGTLALYYITKENLLSCDPANPTVTTQIGEQFAYGVEAAVGFRVTSYLAVDANIALLDAQFRDFTELSGGVPVSCDGNRPPNVPELTANLWAVFNPLAAWRLGAGLRYVGERYADNANTIHVPDYTLVDAFVAYAPARWWSLTLRGRNLTDAIYAIAPYGPTQFILGEPRVIELVANLRF